VDKTSRTIFCSPMMMSCLEASGFLCEMKWCTASLNSGWLNSTMFCLLVTNGQNGYSSILFCCTVFFPDLLPAKYPAIKSRGNKMITPMRIPESMKQIFKNAKLKNHSHKAGMNWGQRQEPRVKSQ